MFKKKDKAKKGKGGEDAPEADAPEAAKDAPEGGEGAEGAEGEAPKKKGLPIKLIAIALVALLVLGGGGGGAAWFFLVKPKADAAHKAGEKEVASKDKKKEKKKEKKGEKKEGGKEGEQAAGSVKEGPDGVYFYTIPSLTVNMQASDGRPTFLKLDVVLEIPEESVAEDIDPAMPRVKDMLQTFLRELRPEDLSGSQGTFRLRQELQRRVNLMIAPAKVNAVLIEGMLIT
jgi:flagellar FliL protein